MNGLRSTPASEGSSLNDARTSGETPDTKGRIYELAASVARLVCVRDVAYVDDPEGHRALDLDANELGHLLGLVEPEFANIWREDDALGRRRDEAKCGWKAGQSDCERPGCYFPGDRCLIVQQERAS